MRQRIARNRGEKDDDYHGRSGCGWACGRRVLSVSVFFFFTMVSNGVDSALPSLKVRVTVGRVSSSGLVATAPSPAGLDSKEVFLAVPLSI